MNKIKKGDQVIMRTGKDKGKMGEVRLVMPTGYVLVNGINLVKKHQRANPRIGVDAAIIDKEMPVHISNLSIFNPATSKADKVGFKLLADGRKVRYFKSTNDVIDG